jgi:stage IV sporulation protein B
VVALSDVEGYDNNINSPAAQSGIQIGDCILKINDKNITNSDETLKQINNCQGKEIKLLTDRNGVSFERIVTPVKSKSDDSYKIGLWVRDSTAGIGTLTFYDPKTNMFGALGHPITDIDTGTILKVSTGNITNSSILSVKKGMKGEPGELRGIFINEDNPMGNIIKNTSCGIFGEGNKSIGGTVNTELLKIGTKEDVKEGPAKIITTIDGNKPEQFDILIEKLLQQSEPGPKSMVIKVTDKRLLEKTGGIVQGMSGSPIIQENKIIGAVTHVLVNKPDTGYGIYIEWMIKEGNILER